MMMMTQFRTNQQAVFTYCIHIFPHASLYMADLEEDQWMGRPTEEERLAWEERHQKREKLSNTMGQYLLKGYRMLGTNCKDCGNILLRTRDGVDLCVFCTEIEPKVKNQGATSQEDLTPNNQEASGASDDLHQAQHQDSASGSHEQSHTVLEGHRMTSDIYNTVVPYTDTKRLPVQLTDVLHSAQQTLISKLRWATQELEATSSVDHATQLCRLIKECTDALKSMREIPPHDPPPCPVKLSV